MDPRAVLAAFDEQIRQHPRSPNGPEGSVERDAAVVRLVSDGDGWTGITWTGLSPDGSDADAAITTQIARFTLPPRDWEWKHYSYDQPPDLADRLLAAGFVAQPPETLLVAEVAELDLEGTLPPEVHLEEVVDRVGIDALVAVHDTVFGGDHSGVGRSVLATLGRDPVVTVAVLARAGAEPISSGRLEFHPGTDFASLWGGGTLPAWRGRGVFRALVAHRAALAATRGFRYLQVDASAESRPILGRLGFVELATTTPFIYPGGPASS